MTAPAAPQHQIRAQHTDTTITVYQAYSRFIGLPAARDGRFPTAWKRDRMTWIKPSFLWMMYRCGWATKEGQETVLAVEISREGIRLGAGQRRTLLLRQGSPPGPCELAAQSAPVPGPRPVGPRTRPPPQSAPAPLPATRSHGRGGAAVRR